MPQVSRFKLRKVIEERIFEAFYASLAKKRTKDEVKKILDDLLTPTERIMLAKRLAIALLLLQSYDYRSIRDFLNVSYGTIGRIANWLKVGGAGFRETLEKLENQDQWRRLLEKIATIYTKITPAPYSLKYHRLKKRLQKKTPF